MWVLEEWEGVLPGWWLMVVLSAHARHGASQRGLLGQGQWGRAGGRGPRGSWLEATAESHRGP